MPNTFLVNVNSAKRARSPHSGSDLGAWHLFWTGHGQPETILYRPYSVSAHLINTLNMPARSARSRGDGRLPRGVSYSRSSLAERCYNILRWTVMPRGGHFAAMEQAGLLAQDIREFFRPLR